MALSKASLDKLSTCHPDLQFLVMELAEVFPVQVVYGHRNEVDQNKAFAEGKSQKQWPNSKHNSQPSMAVDLAPLEFDTGKASIDWKDRERFCYMAGYVMAFAHARGIKLRSGIDWDQDTELKDEKGLRDYPHLEKMV